ncbi:hypothetical protein ADJ73_02735 [Arsenicicoccus sp. oral taxon 190]|nr:hypothetical protein ADJ73_02735 [Arsenicicoccus sp. oral taxon 190]
MRTAARVVAAPALATGARQVRVVTTQVVAGSPVVSTSTVAATQAVAAVDKAQDAPGAVAVAVDTRVATSTYNDPLRPEKWDLTALGGETFHARVATSRVTVAVVDTGVDGTHPDLRGVLVPGAEFLSKKPGSTASTGSGAVDANGHGTHVAGIIAAVADNRIGTAGLAPGTHVMPVRTMGADGSGWCSDVARGIYYATQHGAAVINLSLTGGSDATLAKAVEYATSHGVVVVAAAGNDRLAGNPISYPAAYPGVIGVGAATRTRAAAPFSNTGSYVDLVAPGVDIVSTYPTRKIASGYAAMDGTSMATPMVSATVAGLKAARPSLTPAQVQAVLASTATDLGVRGTDQTFGAGLVNPVRALCTVSLCPATLGWSAPTWTPAFGTLARPTLVVRTAIGAPVPGAPVQACYRLATSGSTSCVTRRADAAGRVDLSFAARTLTTVTARFLGTATATPATSVATVRTTYAVRAAAAPRAVTTAVSPRQTTVNLDRWDTRRRSWAYARTLRTTPGGAATFTGVAPGSYRVYVPGSSVLAAAATGAVVVR